MQGRQLGLPRWLHQQSFGASVASGAEPDVLPVPPAAMQQKKDEKGRSKHAGRLFFLRRFARCTCRRTR